MAQLEPCPHCRRHVRLPAETCPFCQGETASVFARVTPRKLPAARLGRAALFAFGVSAAAASLPACEDDSKDDDGKSSDAGSGKDAGKPGADEMDGGADSPSNGDNGGDSNAGSNLGDEDSGGPVAIYGAAPSDQG